MKSRDRTTAFAGARGSFQETTRSPALADAGCTGRGEVRKKSLKPNWGKPSVRFLWHWYFTLGQKHPDFFGREACVCGRRAWEGEPGGEEVASGTSRQFQWSHGGHGDREGRFSGGNRNKHSQGPGGWFPSEAEEDKASAISAWTALCVAKP